MNKNNENNYINYKDIPMVIKYNEWIITIIILTIMT